MLRRIVVHWISERRLARLKAEFAAAWRARARRAQERRVADDEAWRALVCVQDDEDVTSGADRPSILAACLRRRRIGANADRHIYKLYF
ncbi:MAG: hypothetical protein KGI92_07795 [Alphaproteobacteria bacterium]|nr:hypothetical protein [Alphaproteobacteria bacterium]MDE2513749.1 hypothetical protein [Alphaproteobacteria bacterium]